MLYRYLLLVITLLFGQIGSLYGADQLLDIDLARWSQMGTRALVDQGLEYIHNGNHTDSALVCFTIAANRYREGLSDDEKLACIAAYNNGGYIYHFRYFDYSSSYAYLIKAMEISERDGLEEMLPSIYLNLGHMYQAYAGQYDSKELHTRATNLYKKTIESSLPVKDWETLVKSAANLFTLELMEQQLDSISETLDLFDSLIIPENIPRLQYTRRLCEGIRYVRQKRYAMARRAFWRQLEVIDSPVSPERYETQVTTNVIITFGMEQRYDSALYYCNRLDSLSKVYHLKDIEEDCSKLYYRYYSALGMMDQADAYRTIYLNKKDSIMVQHHMEEVGEMHFLYELKQVEKRMSEIREQKERQTARFIAALIIAALLGTSLIIIYKKNRIISERSRLLYQRYIELLEIEKQRHLQAEKYHSSNLSESDKDSLHEKIEQVMQDPTMICSADFSVAQLAQQVGSNTKYVSQVINEKYGKNFSSLLSERRIHQACIMMQDHAHYGHLTIEALAQEVGIKSRSTFVLAFRRTTGFTPSEYQNIAKKG